MFQSTRPRGARLGKDSRICRRADVSIHAPTWGATFGDLDTTTIVSVSIHAPTWGATVHFVSNGSGQKVSIHAPTWGATHSNISKAIICFNPRAHVGRDLKKPYVSNTANRVQFQSTRPRGARQTVCSSIG